MSLIYNRDNVPSAYADKSRDYQVLLKLFDLLTNGIKLNLEHFSSLLNPETCPDHMLPLLASFLEYNYDYNETYESNRTVMRYYPKLIRQKGNEIGMRTAMLLSCDISGSEIPDLNTIVAQYDYANATIYLYYPSYLNKVRDLIEVVRPAGMKIVMLTYDAIGSVEVIGIYDDLLVINQEDYYGTLKQYTSDPKSYYVMDENNRYIIGIGTDSRSVVSDEYRNGKSIIIPSNSTKLTYPIFSKPGDTSTESKNINPGDLNGIDSNNYLKQIKPSSEEYLQNKPELVEGSEEALNNIKHQSRIGFSEIAGIREEGDE